MEKALPATRLRAALLLVVLSVTALPPLLARQDDEPAEPPPGGAVEDRIEVVALTPIDSLGVPRDRAPWSPHRLEHDELPRAGRGLAAALEQSLPGVHLGSAQGNPLQPEVSYRGFATSPLLGASQELSVYEDGVRVNEIFGDVVAWDLIPAFALEQVDLVSGANPSFGLNALGGALTLVTRSGFRAPVIDATVAGGSWRRRAAEASTGRAGERWALFAGAGLLDEDGWRDFSPSRSRQGLVKLARRAERTRWTLALGLGENRLVGNGAAPVQLLELDRAAVFTHPDRTENRLVFPRWRLDRQLGASLDLEAVVHLRTNDVDTFNADAFDADDDGEDDDALAEGEAEGNDLDDPPGPEPPFDGVENRSRTEQEGWGVSAQLGWSPTERERPFRLLGGLSWEAGAAEFGSSSELARLTPIRTSVGSGELLAGSRVGVAVDVRRLGLRVAAHASPRPVITLTAQVGYARSSVRLADRLGVELDGDHRYRRLLPALGVAWQLRERDRASLTLFANASQSSRVPTPVELTCADPDDPCRLPNAFVSDPPLDQVVTRSGELGLRGAAGPHRWTAALFRSDSRDDIVFVSSGASTSLGFFRNVDATRREGLELAASGRRGRLSWQTSYAWVEATYRDRLALPSPHHPRAVDGEIDVAPGDRLPGIPRHQLRARLGTDLSKRVTVEAALRHDSSRFRRGDEANLLEPVPGAWLADAAARVGLRPGLFLSVRVDNLFDRRHSVFGALGDATEVLSEAFDDPRFVTPGAPRSLLVSLWFSPAGAAADR
ncbi:MAG TPA: TonB-dependent receptor [Thermoanaerobaculia bacterium]|nr:TonB-dependent receptor [Thermoanaerobaculia bacterium]